LQPFAALSLHVRKTQDSNVSKGSEGLRVDKQARSGLRELFVAMLPDQARHIGITCFAVVCGGCTGQP